MVISMASGRPSERRLLTGDLGRIRPSDGCLEYLGRRDSIVKVGGMRVSPAQVDSRILETPGVAHAVVNMLGNSLTAWLVPQAGLEINREAVRHHLCKHLPTEAVPTRFVSLAAFPLLPDGKIDRKVLNEAHPAVEETARPLLDMAPRHEFERLVLTAFEEVLERGELGIYQSFFELGGRFTPSAKIARSFVGRMLL